MLNPSSTFTSLVIDAPGVDPKLLGMPSPLSMEAVVAAIRDAFSDPPPSVDDSDSPGLVTDDGSSQSSSSPLHTPLHSPEIHPHISLPPQYDSVHYVLPPSPATPTSSGSVSFLTSRVLAEAPCAGGKPLKQNGGGYRCSTCDVFFKRRDDAKRHIDSTGMRVECKYCGKTASGRRDGQLRHLKSNQACWKAWEAGYKTGRFTVRTVEDAYSG